MPRRCSSSKTSQFDSDASDEALDDLIKQIRDGAGHPLLRTKPVGRGLRAQGCRPIVQKVLTITPAHYIPKPLA